MLEENQLSNEKKTWWLFRVYICIIYIYSFVYIKAIHCDVGGAKELRTKFCWRKRGKALLLNPYTWENYSDLGPGKWFSEGSVPPKSPYIIQV